LRKSIAIGNRLPSVELYEQRSDFIKISLFRRKKFNVCVCVKCRKCWSFKFIIKLPCKLIIKKIGCYDKWRKVWIYANCHFLRFVPKWCKHFDSPPKNERIPYLWRLFAMNHKIASFSFRQFRMLPTFSEKDTPTADWMGGRRYFLLKSWFMII
jgi:hypothetical protein